MPAAALLDPGAAAALRADLEAADYTLDAIGELLGTLAATALHREHPTYARAVTAQDAGPLATLVDLFALGVARPLEQAAAALAQLTLQRAEAIGLVSVQGDQVRGAMDLRPYGDDSHSWWVVSDLGEGSTGGPLPIDHVLGIGGASTTLASWTPRPQVATALDLGTGCGVQSLHLSEHAEVVTATDVSERALAMAAFNAALNGLEWELRPGSLFAPVAGQRFDLVVSNPPFVITPRRPDMPVYEYRDGGLAGHEICQQVISQVGAHLNPGGIAQVLANWEVGQGQRWQEVVEGWLEGSGLDAWVIQREVQDPAQYAETWVRDGGHLPGSPQGEAMLLAWVEDFAARQVDTIGFGIITLQRPSAERANFRDLMEVTGPVAAPMGPHILAGLAARTWLAEHTDEEVLRTPWCVAPDVTVEEHRRPLESDPSVIAVRQGGGLGQVHHLGTASAGYLSVADGDLAPAQSLPALAQLLERPVPEVIAEVLPQLKRLIADGILT